VITGGRCGERLPRHAGPGVRLRQIEAALERVLDGAFARVAGGRLHPLEVFEALWERMEGDRAVSSGGVYVPNRLMARVSPADFQAFEGLKDRLEQELAANLQEQCTGNGWLYGARVLVRLQGDEKVRPGLVRVDASFDERPLPAHLIVQNGLAHDQRFLVGDGSVLGRSAECAIVIPDNGVSRRHCRFDWTFRGYQVSDLGSTNGTSVNAVGVTEYTLSHGDVVGIGDVRALFEYDPVVDWPTSTA